MLYNIDSDTDVYTEEGKMKETYMRRKKGEHKPRNIDIRIRSPQPSLQTPRVRYGMIDWNNPNGNVNRVRPMYVPPLPEDREQFLLENSQWIHDGRWGDWIG